MKITYILGYIELDSGKITYEKETYKTPDEALYNLQETIGNVIKKRYNMEIKTSSINEFNFISSDLPYIVVNDKLSMECVKNYLEDFQILIHYQTKQKGYLYNTTSTKPLFNFFLKQVQTPEMEFTPEIKSLVESFKQISLIDELKGKVKDNKLVKILVPSRRKVFESDFQKELAEKVIKKIKKN